jgi:hypothetical protein
MVVLAVILATQAMEIGGSWFEAQSYPSERVNKTQFQKQAEHGGSYL